MRDDIDRLIRELARVKGAELNDEAVREVRRHIELAHVDGLLDEDSDDGKAQRS